MVPTSAHVRAGCWLFSAALHVVAFAATGHSPRAPAAAQGDAAEPIVIDVVQEPPRDVSAPSIATADTRSAAFVPRPTHTHAYPVPIDHDAHPHDPSLVHLPFALPAPMPSEAIVAPERFTMTVGTDGPRPSAETAASHAAEPAGDPRPGDDAMPLTEDGVSSPARLATPMSPAYPAEARAQEVEADVVLEIVVASTGEVVNARVLEAAGFGFDEEALRAVHAARFIPAQRAGRRVAVRMRWSWSFRLR